MAGVPYLKMNGLGNDFVVVDARADGRRFTPEAVRAITDRVKGVGADQFIVMEKPAADGVDVFMRIYNCDGGEIDACGNATRCVAALVAEEVGKRAILLQTNAGLLAATVTDDLVTVDMGKPRFDWDQIPLSEEFADTTGIELQIGPIDAPILHTPSVVNVGNPHAIFWVSDIAAYDLGRFGPLLENHPIFPERANISLAQVVSPERIKVRVWERGAGLTLACGTAACAVGVAAARKGLTGRKVTVELPGGPLEIDWRASDGHILMTGTWSLDGEGVLPDEWLKAA
ncbi:MAG: diaminopimelate epimerase [Devosia sp. 67-54]|uniref:diaminopimelate epimerase n=1 Tax=unclassified Devosia TaxID=196773 RepID=UPI0009643990|nr:MULTISPECIES: diaminopimelate epimerase [unclassified Devosia]MBN9305267.1 diaminopimelate epimerase [Devosia sp.]OJX15554.1 MAG: diaminopimelate epimerase [Devosia sp. 67-54]